jgi:hypothetical protein
MRIDSGHAKRQDAAWSACGPLQAADAAAQIVQAGLGGAHVPNLFPFLGRVKWLENTKRKDFFFEKKKQKTFKPLPGSFTASGQET